MQSIGARNSSVKSIFILPTPPKGQYILSTEGHLLAPSVVSIISQDGNHWRKILTIMAKLCAPDGDWRQYRDSTLLTQYERIEFTVPTELDDSVIYFICGGQMQTFFNKELEKVIYLNEKKTLAVCNNLIFCPYLDYRQYPNIDIESTRHYLEKHLEKRAF